TEPTQVGFVNVDRGFIPVSRFMTTHQLDRFCLYSRATLAASALGKMVGFLGTTVWYNEESETHHVDIRMKTLEKATKRKVIMAKEVGFCFGVKRAINLTRQALAERSDVFILGDLVHNKRVTDELENKGLRKVDDYTGEKSGTMVIRAHGLPKAKIREAKDRGMEVVDATCPIVLRAQEAAQALEARGCQVVIIGDRNHAEIKGILGALEHPALVVHNVQELQEAKESHKLMRKVGVIFQTTHALELC